jgi:small conductance mechanosensitive channel
MSFFRSIRLFDSTSSQHSGSCSARSHVDETIAHYLNASAIVVLKLLTLIAVLGVLGIETTSFAALLAAVGLAVGAAWSGLLANFAAGLFLLSFRPFNRRHSA